MTNEQDTAASFAWIVPDGLTKVSDSHSGGKATIWLSGGSLGTIYPVTCRITTTGGRVDDRTLEIAIRRR